MSEPNESNPHDLFLWPDGMWCLRQEFNDKYAREKNYRVVEHGTKEWFELAKAETYLQPKPP